MTSSTLSLLCAALLLVLAVIFSLESRRGSRYVEPVRVIFDKTALYIWSVESKVSYSVSHGRIRLFLHYLLHRLLAVSTKFLSKVENILIRLQRRNRNVARSLTQERKTTHLTQIKAHQKATALSVEEKQDLRDKTLAGE